MKRIKERYKHVADLWVDIENIFILLYLGLGAYGIAGLKYKGSPIASIIYISSAIVLVISLTYLHKRAKAFCFGKRYSSAWGIVAAELYKTGNCKGPYAPIIAKIAVAIVTFIPILLMSWMLYYFPFSRVTMNILIGFVAMSIVQFVIHKEFSKRFSMDYDEAPEAYK
ncbi:MAG: hypothetical protein ABIF92_02725 [archaeon]